jgi:hypothetical protein
LMFKGIYSYRDWMALQKIQNIHHCSKAISLWHLLWNDLWVFVSNKGLTFKDVVGSMHVLSLLENMVKNNHSHLSIANLFTTLLYNR